MATNSEYPYPGRVEAGSVSESKEDVFSVTSSTWKGRVWDTFDLPSDQRKLLFKVDAVILTFASLGYFLKNLDQSNVNNAFLSGMKEELGMTSNQLVTAVSIWTVGYVVGQIPSNLLLTRISPRWVIPSLELGWGIATLGSYAVKSYKALYALRFLVGLFESGFYPGIHYMLGSWYTPRELGKRAMIFWVAGSLGTMFSGFLQAAAYDNLEGVHGLAGWRWLFIIDAVITLPIAIMGFTFFPGSPLDHNKTWWLTQEATTRSYENSAYLEQEHDLARTRISRVGRKGKTPWSWSKVRTLFSSWHTYMLPPIYILWNNGAPQSAMGYWLKSFNAKPAPVPGVSYTVSQINTLPLPTTAIFVVAALSWAWLSDGPFRGRRWPFIYIGAVITLVFGVVLRQLPVYQSIKGHYAVYWLSNIGFGAGPLILSWINEICSDDSEKRAILVAAANDLAYVVQAVAPNFVWKTVDFPKATKGFTWVIVLQILLMIHTTAVLYLLRRDRKNGLTSNGSPVASSTEGPFIDGDGSDTDDKNAALFQESRV